MKLLLVIGNDKISRKLLSKLRHKDNIYIVIDKSTNLGRLLHLLRKGVLSVSLVFRMIVAEFFRKNYPLKEKYYSILNNKELLNVIRKWHIERVYLFRAGLIVNKKVLNSGVEVFNTHCAIIPQYGGLGSIMKALSEKVYAQEATLHHVTTRIDEGKVLAVNSYNLNPTLSYMENENIAYDAGINLLLEQLK